MSAAPWWGVPVIAGCFLVAVAVLTFLANLVLKKLELGRADRSKWDQDVLDSAIAIKNLCQRVRDIGNPDSMAYLADISKRISVYRESLESLSPIVDKLSFIASKNLGKSATTLMLASMAEGNKVATPSDSSETGREKRAEVPAVGAALNTFISDVRAELRARS